MPQTTVLVGFAEALSAPEVVWSLVDGGFRVIAFTRKGRASALRYSRHVVCHEICAPESDLQASISDLHSLLISLSAQVDGGELVLLPLDDKALYLCGNVQLVKPWLLAGKEIFDLAAAESFPIILKPAECVRISRGRVRSGRNWICADLGELNRAVEQWAESNLLVVQSFIAGTGEGVFGLAAPDGIRAWSAHRRLRMMNPEGSGSSACISAPVSDDLKENVKALIVAADWRGLFMIELLRDREGTCWFVELNGRSWGSMALSRRQGLEYPAWNVQLAMNPGSEIGKTLPIAPGMICRNIGREFVHVLFVLRGAKSSALVDPPSLCKTLGGVLRVRRGDTFYNWRRDDPKVFFADCYCTIHDNLFKARN